MKLRRIFSPIAAYLEGKELIKDLSINKTKLEFFQIKI